MKHLYGGRCTIAIDVVLIVLLAGLGYGPDWLATCVVHCFLLPLLLLLVVIVVVVVKGCAVVVTVAVSFAWLSCSCDCCRVNAANFVLVVLLADLGYGRDWLATMRGALFFFAVVAVVGRGSGSGGGSGAGEGVAVVVTVAVASLSCCCDCCRVDAAAFVHAACGWFWPM